MFDGVLFACAALVAFLPTLITKKIIFSSYFNFGYTEHWFWNSPAFIQGWLLLRTRTVLLDADHHPRRRRTLLSCQTRSESCTLFAHRLRCLSLRNRLLSDWAGIASFGNRFFVSLTALFVLGLAAFFERLALSLQPRRTAIVATASLSLLILWNLGLMYQWGVHLIPARGPISWRLAVHNQFAVVPAGVFRNIEDYLLRRGKLMQHIEDDDMKQIKSYHPD